MRRIFISIIRCSVSRSERDKLAPRPAGFDACQVGCSIFALVAVAFLPAAQAARAASVFTFGEASAGYTIDRQVRYSFTLENTKNIPLEQGDLWVNIPAQQTAAQWRLRVNASEDAELITDPLGNRVLHFKAVSLPPYGARVINIVADLKLASAPQAMTGQVAAIYGKPGLCAESGAPEIVALAGQLKSKGGKTQASAKAIYEWVSANLKHSGYHKTDRGALWALQNKQGDCSEFASLFTALCRAAGIPARTLSGFTCPKNMILKPYSLHNWAEFFDGSVWRIADPLERNFDANQSLYVAFAILEKASAEAPEPSALFRYEGAGLAVNMNK